MRSIVARDSHFSMELGPALWFVTPMVRAINELDRCRSSTSETRARHRIILSVRSLHLVKVRTDRDVLRVASIFRARRKRGRQRERERGRESRVYERGSRILRYSRGNLRRVRCACDTRKLSRRAHAAAPAHIRIVTATFPVVCRARRDLAARRTYVGRLRCPWLFHSFLASTDSRGLRKSRLRLRFILWILDAVIFFSGARNVVLNVGQICTLSRVLIEI